MAEENNNLTGTSAYLPAERFSSDDMRNIAGSPVPGREQDKQIVTRNQKQQVQKNHAEDQQAMLAEWDEAARKSAYDKYDQNLAKEGAKGNLNNLTFNDTLKRSRLADLYNNHMYTRGGDIGARTTDYGVTGTNDPEYYKNNIETQEMRQMRANETKDALAAQRDIGRAADVEDYALEARKRSDEARSQLASLVGKTDVDIDRLWREVNVQMSWQKPGEYAMLSRMNTFLKRLDDETHTRATAWAYNLFNNNPALGTIMLQAVGNPQELNYYQNLLGKYIAEQCTSAEDLPGAMLTYNTIVYGSQSGQTIDLTLRNLSGEFYEQAKQEREEREGK